VRDDLKKVVGLRGAVRLVRREPRVLWQFLLYLVVTYVLLVVALALAGRLASFGEWAIYPAVLSGSLLGADLYRSRESHRQTTAERALPRGPATVTRDDPLSNDQQNEPGTGQ
jgi:hypothetical protein